jgi:hypothetical protein
VAELPVADLDEPIVYFVELAPTDGAGLGSKPRRCVPRSLGLVRPSTVRGAFVEGFEEGDWNWRNLDERSSVGRIAPGRSSGNSLEVRIHPGQRSAAVATSLLRGPAAMSQRAEGFSVWLRAEPAGATANVLALAHSGTPGQVSASFPGKFTLAETWTRFDFRFDLLPRFPLGALDRIVFEISGEGPSRIWIDDLEWAGF